MTEISDQKYVIAVIGSGYVGLPTAALFAQAGFNVKAVDLRPEIVRSINSGRSPFNEPGLQGLIQQVVKSGRLKAILNTDAILDDENVIVICVQTPIDINNKPNLCFLNRALEDVVKRLKKQTLLVICSTIPPGTMHGIIRPYIESISSLKVDIDFYLAYVPERIAPGTALKELVENQRLVGGIGPNSTKKAVKLFETICRKIIETDALTAEIAKTAENTFRDVNIAFANHLSLICEEYDADSTKVIKVANTHPRVNIHNPGPGVGGPCLTKDPYLLIYKSVQKHPNIVTIAREINDYMPNHIVKLTMNALKFVGKNINNAKISVLGTAYKADVDDSRFSPSEFVIQKILSLGAVAFTYDPYCPVSFGAKKVDSIKEAVKKMDCIILMTDHSEFRNLPLNEIKKLMNDNPIILDGKRILDPNETKGLGFIYCGIGYRRLRNTID